MNIIRGQLKTLGGVAFIVGLVLFFAGLNSPRALAGTIYVDADATLGVKDGSDWENAFTNINAALAVAVAGDEIWVAEGTYTGAVTLKQGVGVYGGFNGTEESRDERDFDQYITTISNNQDGPTVTGVNGSKIDGCTITHATGNNGSGIRCYQVAVTIENNHIKGNNTLSDGGGIYCNDGAPIIVNNRIEGNFAEAGYGGGIFLRNVTSSEAMVSNNIIELNSAKRGAGLCAFYDNSVTVKNNLIRFNHATVRGGGAWLGQGCISNIMNNVIAWNRAYSGGGGLYCERSSVGLPMIINNTFFVNTTDTGLNYGIYCYLAYPTIMNTIIYNYGNAIVDGDSLYFSYNNLNGDDPLFEGPDVLDPVNFDFHLSEGSPDIDTGNPAISDPDGTISDKGAYGGPWAGMIGPDYNPPDLVIEYDPNDPNSYFEQQGPSGTTITFVTTNENGTMFLWGQAEGNSVLIARAWDDDGQSTMLLEPDPNGGLFGPGENILVITVQDSFGHIASDSATLVVSDTVPPVLDEDPLPELTDECSVTVDAAPTATDACVSEPITGTTSDPLVYEEQGTFTITWTYDDGSGNIITQTQTVVVDDTTAPVPDVDPLPDAIGQCEVTLPVPTGTDNCGGTVTVTTSDPTTYTDQGTYMVTWTYADENGNSTTRTQTVIVDDTTAPVPDVDPLPDVTGQCEATVSVPTGTDNCGGAVTVTTSDPTTYTDQGTYTVTWTYTDELGNSTTRTQTVIVDDTTLPVVDAGANRTVDKGKSVNLQATATDNCTETGNFVYEWREGTTVLGTGASLTRTFGVGTHTVVLSVTDQAGNTGTDTVTVKVKQVTRVQTFPYYFQTFQFPYSFLGTQIPSFQPAILYRPSIPSFYQFPSAYTFPQFQMGQFGTTGYPFYLNFLR